ncbi:MAG: hypothetical protein L6Q75_06440 [Burkholderiaceae bacterium]|nr:hypothetical protein [Burkholderiaceae bacterium]
MYLVAIGWLYVALMMALAEGMSPTGGWLGAAVTFVLYGLLPVGLVLYLMGTPLRRRQQRAAERAEKAELRTETRPVTAVPPEAAGPAGTPPH